MAGLAVIEHIPPSSTSTSLAKPFKMSGYSAFSDAISLYMATVARCNCCKERIGSQIQFQSGTRSSRPFFTSLLPLIVFLDSSSRTISSAFSRRSYTSRTLVDRVAIIISSSLPTLHQVRVLVLTAVPLVAHCT